MSRDTEKIRKGENRLIDGKKFKKCRTAAGLSIPELAEKVGLTRQIVWRFENEMKDPSLALAAQMASEMHCKVDDFLKAVRTA
jgi:DNA-binding XRE family transcriptional regulator